MPKRKSNAGRLAREAKRDEPQLVEGPKHLLCLRGHRTNDMMVTLLREFSELTKPYSRLLTRKNDIRPFEDASSLEFLCNKNRCGSFALVNHNKKRPNNLVLGRVFDGQMLDMQEFGVEGFNPMDMYPEAGKPGLGDKPLMLFQGGSFDTDPDLARAKSLLIDAFRGHTMPAIALPSLSYAMVVTLEPPTATSAAGAAAEEGALLTIRHYFLRLKRSGSKVPNVELQDMGMFLNLRLRRHIEPTRELQKLSLRVPRQNKAKKVKNVSHNVFGEKLGRVHMHRQDFDKLYVKKTRGMKEVLRSKGHIDTPSQAKKRRDRPEAGEEAAADEGLAAAGGGGRARVD